MVTELLERTVIPMCKDQDITYHITPDGKVRIPFRIPSAVIHFTIADHEIGLLVISARDFVRFDEDQVAYATTMCNELNLMGPGKFTIDEDGDVSYRLDFPANETAGPSEFRQAFELALDALAGLHPVVMRVRWANATVAQAVASEDGTPGKPPPTDEDLEKLFGHSDRIDPEG